MSNVTINDGGSYVAKLEVIHPETGSYSSIQKTITLTVEVVNGKSFSDMFCYDNLGLIVAVHAYNAVTVETPELDEESFQLCIGPFFLSDCSALAVSNINAKPFSYSN